MPASEGAAGDKGTNVCQQPFGPARLMSSELQEQWGEEEQSATETVKMLFRGERSRVRGKGHFGETGVSRGNRILPRTAPSWAKTIALRWATLFRGAPHTAQGRKPAGYAFIIAINTR